MLGETELSEKVLLKALKNNSSNLELNAIYSQFLITNNRFDEAVKIAEILRGTKYGSIFSEASIKKTLNSSHNIRDFYKDKKNYNIYLDAYKSSKNPLWLRNCAIFNMTEGLYDVASSLIPTSFKDADDAYFWALVMYDAGDFYSAIEILDISMQLLKDYPESKSHKMYKTTQVQQIALQSDAYMAISNLEKANETREIIISAIDELNSEIESSLLPLIITNSAIYAKSLNQNDKAVDLLFECVNRWPNYVPALILYSDFAYSSNQIRNEDFEIKMLRESGISSMEMESYDNRRIVPLSDALYRIDKALENSKDPYLSIAKLDLKYKLNPKILEKEKIADLWNLLEKNYSEEVKFENLLVQYTISYLLKTKKIDEAYMLFTKYIKNSFEIDDKEEFWPQVNQYINYMDVKMVEFAAWFATYFGIYEEAFRFYEYVVFESGGISYEGMISPVVSTESCLNLADMYYSTGKKDFALDLYGKTAGREVRPELRSECFYRIASIYDSIQDKKNALRSIDYALSINPNNARAALLKSKLVK